MRETKIQSTKLFPKTLAFRAFDNDVDGTDADSYIITTTAYVHKGTKFSLTKANFSGRADDGPWSSGNRGVASIQFEYLGLNPIPPSTNLCVFIGPEGIVDYTDILINGNSIPGTFAITSENSESINVSTTQSETIYITQGQFIEDGNGYSLAGNVIDGLAFGMTNNEWQAEGIPGELPAESSGIGTAAGSYYGVLQCDGLLYICEFLDLQPFIENWAINQNGSGGGGGLGNGTPNDGSLCEELCDLLCVDCDIMPTIYSPRVCELYVNPVNCEPPFNYKWQRNTPNGWVTLLATTSLDGNIPPYSPVYLAVEYRLIVECSETCVEESNTFTMPYCAPEPCLATITPAQNDCHMGITVQNCSPAGFIWSELIDGEYVVIPGVNGQFYSADHGGIYRVAVIGCNKCNQLFWDFEVNSFDITASVGQTEVCSYSVCLPIDASVDNITVGGGLSLSPLPGFNFEYDLSSNFDITQMVDDINSWLADSGNLGTANFRYGGKTCIGVLLVIENSNIEFTSITYSYISPDGNGDQTLVTVDFNEYNCRTIDFGYQLSLSDLCPNYTSILWETGETTETITVNNSGDYSVTVNCGNGCVYEETITVVGDDDDDDDPAFLQTPEGTIPEALRDVSNKDAIKVYPNPGRGTFYAEVLAPEYEQITASLYSTTGAKLKELGKSRSTTGAFKFYFNIEDLPTGIYFFKVNEMLQNNTSKVILIR